MRSDPARELRDAFDREFASAPRPPEAGLSDFLCVRIGGEAAAIAAADIASLHADLAIAALPTPAPELLGVAAIRAAIVPIYDLRFAFGATGGAIPRWTVLARSGGAAFAFEAYEGHTRVDARAITAAPHPGCVRGQLTVDRLPRAIVDLPSVLTAIETRWRRKSAAKEP